ncbi:MAG: HWE histidine kinase domain-containing protein, partial [Caulobacteraceae bacterium]
MSASVRQSARSRRPDFGGVFESTARPLLLMEADPPRFTMVAVNRAHARAFGTTPEALIGRGVIEVFGEALPAEVQAFVDAIRISLGKVLANGRSHQMGVAPLAAPGPGGRSEERFWSAVNSPVRDKAGRITHIVSAAQDVTGEVLERRSEEARSLLMREVDHRARNSLTVVQSLIRFAHADTVEAFRDVLEGRVTALARAHASLAARRWEGAWLGEVLRGALE